MPATSREQLVVRRPAPSRRGSSRPVTTGLCARTRSPGGRHRREQRRAHDRLADARVGAGDEQSAHAQRSCAGRARLTAARWMKTSRSPSNGALADAIGSRGARSGVAHARVSAETWRSQLVSLRSSRARQLARVREQVAARSSPSSRAAAPMTPRGLAQLLGACARPSPSVAVATCPRDRRRADRLREHAALERRLAQATSRRAHRPRSAGRCASPSLRTGKPSARERPAQRACIRAQSLHAMRALLQQLQRRQRARDRRWRAERSRRSASARC